MGIFIGKPYKQLDRATGQWVLKTPPPVDFVNKRQCVPVGSRHGRMAFILVEKHSGKK